MQSSLLCQAPLQKHDLKMNSSPLNELTSVIIPTRIPADVIWGK